jgi:hypothetical protein
VFPGTDPRGRLGRLAFFGLVVDGVAFVVLSAVALLEELVAAGAVLVCAIATNGIETTVASKSVRIRFIFGSPGFAANIGQSLHGDHIVSSSLAT